MAIVALVNQKGGVGKTGTTMHLGGALARRGLRVLVADNDPQSSLTKGLLGVAQARRPRPRQRPSTRCTPNCPCRPRN